jgi:hypothetical protein
VTAGGVPDAGIVATDIATNNGNYYPKVAARRDKAEWLMSMATGFVATSVQRVGAGAGGGGTPTPVPAPPPPPPCTPTPAPTSLWAIGGQSTFAITITASAGCAWSASSGAAWLQVLNASGTGSASIAVTALHNTSMAARTGTITINGQTVTVQQVGFNPAAVTDLDGDGLSDLVWQNRSTGALAMWTMHGNSVASTQWLNTPTLTDPAWRVAGTGDINGDGFADIVWQNANDGTVAAWSMQGTQMLSAGVLTYSPVNPKWKIRGVADINGDGKADLIWQHDDGWLAAWLMNGYTVTSTVYLSVPRMFDPMWIIVGAGDVNRDSKADLIWQNQSDNGLGVWLMNGPTVVAQRVLSVYPSDMNWKVHGVGDVNADGLADLLWQNEATGALGVWYMNGFSVIGQYGLQLKVDLSWNMVGPG